MSRPLGHAAAVCALVALILASALQFFAVDDATNPDPRPFWGKIDCGYPNPPGSENYVFVSSRHQQIPFGGDTHPYHNGSPRLESAYRRLTTLDGDLLWSGERCELGYNNHSTNEWDGLPGPGPTVFYREGDHVVTYISVRLPSTYALHSSHWQVVTQMKQAQPYNNDLVGALGQSTPGQALEMQARSIGSGDCPGVVGPAWVLGNNWEDIWCAPAEKNVWTRFRYEVRYSQYPAKGWARMNVDLNGDRDFTDAYESQPPIDQIATLKREGPANGEDYGPPSGASIPSHLRAGYYHNEAINCPPPTGCSAEIDNVEVIDLNPSRRTKLSLRVKAGARAHFFGRLRGASGRRLEIKLVGGGKARVLKTKTGSKGRFHLSRRLSAGSRYRARAVFRGDGFWRSAKSPQRAFRG